MADLNISMVNGGAESFRITPDTSAKATDRLKEQIEDESSRKERAKEVLKDVIAVSKDGDTAQASQKSKNKLKETEELGDVRELTPPKNETEISSAKQLLEDMKESEEGKPSAAQKMMENIKEAEEKEPSTARKMLEDIREAEQNKPSTAEKLMDTIREAEEKEPSPARKMLEDIREAEQNKPSTAEKLMESIKADEDKKQAVKEPATNTFNELKKADNKEELDSYSDSQLRQMYVQGDISRYAYDHETTVRSERSAETASEINNEKVFEEGIVRAMGNENRAELSEENIDRAFDEAANDNLKAEQRMAMVDAAELE